MTKEQTERSKELADNLKINVLGSKSGRTCNIVDHFEENFKTGIDIIDSIEKNTYRNAEYRGLYVIIKDTHEVIFELNGNDAMILSRLSNFLIGYLGIKITKI